MELVEVACEVELLLCPDSLQASDELSASPVPFPMIKPPLSYRRELRLEPAGHYVDGNASLGVIVDASNLFRGDGWIPRPWKQSCHHRETFCKVE